MSQTINGIFTVCSGTTEEWNKYDPILEKAEIGHDSTINDVKIGDGINRWSTLGYLVSDNPTIQGINGVISKNTSTINDHINNNNNPHNVTWQQIGAAPRLINGTTVPNTINTRIQEEREKSLIFVSKDNEDNKVSLQDIKEMSTKIMCCEQGQETETIINNGLSEGDYVYVIK